MHLLINNLELLSWLNKHKIANNEDLLRVFRKEKLETLRDVRSLRCCDDSDLSEMGMKGSDRKIILKILEQDQAENPQDFEEFNDSTGDAEEEDVDEIDSEIDDSRGIKKSYGGMSQNSEMICRTVFLIALFGSLLGLIMYLIELESHEPTKL